MNNTQNLKWLHDEEAYITQCNEVNDALYNKEKKYDVYMSTHKNPFKIKMILRRADNCFYIKDKPMIMVNNCERKLNIYFESLYDTIDIVVCRFKNKEEFYECVNYT